jgi:hypothetical protein
VSVSPISPATTAGHEVTVGWVANNHGYPYKARCSCGWASPGYVATHAAEGMADWHLAEAR